jgi:hypothetical protein
MHTVASIHPWRQPLAPRTNNVTARISLTSLFGKEFAAIEQIEFFGAYHKPLKTMRILMRTFSTTRLRRVALLTVPYRRFWQSHRLESPDRLASVAGWHVQKLPLKEGLLCLSPCVASIPRSFSGCGSHNFR